MEVAKNSQDETDSIRLSQEHVVQLWSYQYGLRLRHLTQVVGRNLQGNDEYPIPTPVNPLPSKNSRPPPTHGYYFTIHKPSNKEEIYTSELQSTVNPSWQELQPENIKPIHLRSLKGVLIRLWFKPQDKDAILVTSWGIHFGGLVPIGPHLSYDQKYEPNTLVLKLRHVFYTAPGNFHPDQPNHTFPLRYGYALPLSETKRSYTVNSLTRLHSTKRAQRQQEIRCQENGEVLEMRGVTRTSNASLMATQVEDCRMKVALLREQLEAEIDQLRALKLSADNLDNQNQEKGLQLLGGYQGLHRQVKQGRKLHEKGEEDTDSLKFTCSTLKDWRRELLHQIPLIYPLTQENEKVFRICGVHLPDAESYDNFSELALSVGLGFVAHLVVLVSHLMNLPLRYPITPYGSLATITDITSVQLRDREREFPLYTRGKEREKLHFHYGVFLLNKNIAQIRWYFGIPTPDLRPTLPNLAALLARLTQMSASNQPATVMPDILMPLPSGPTSVALEVRTPTTLLHQHRAPRLPLNPLGRSTSQDAKVASTDNEDESPVIEKSLKSDSEAESPSDSSPVKMSLYVREALPLETEGSGKFVFVDKVVDPLVNIGHMDKHLEERLSHSNGFSFSLDNGLNHIGGKHNPYYKISDMSSCDDLKLMNNVSKTLSIVRGSDPNLLNKTESMGIPGEGEEDILPVFKEQTTELLRSWHEDAPSHYLGVSEVSATDRLEEVGMECDESFMCPESKSNVTPTPDSQNGEEKRKSPQESGIQDAMEKDSSVEDNKDTKDESTAEKNEKESESMPLSLSEFGVTEDMFLNDVAFRTAALASQSFSFKMSFSRQSTEDEYH